ncbi:MAG: protein kinase [Verrucomicrobiales bacterium]|nr:protein kinase [Verrucomicrobiales bacterium]
MENERKCSDCGGTLATADVQPVCPACIFRRLSNTSSTVYPAQSADTTPRSGTVPEGDSDTDFYAEYELLGEIGRGGMGVIYKAHQPGLNRTVAVKAIHAAGLVGDVARRRFQAEVQMAGRLNHPNIVPVYDVGVMDGCPCFSMEYFPGGSLADRLGRSVLRIEDGVALLTKVARAVYFAHQHGVLHRDLKPANILFDSVGEPHVADFGLAKELGSGSDLTRSGAVLGSPSYMSPEQAAGRSASLSVATDIYSLGGILYELLTGRPPFLGATPLETLRLVVEEEPQRPSMVAGPGDRDLETICLKCLEKEPSRRYATAGDLAADLERWLRHEPIHARPVSSGERFFKWARRHPALAGVSALLLVVLLAGMSGVTWQWRKAEEARRSETQQLRRAEAALARSAIALAESSLREGNGPATQAALDTVPVELRDATWAYLLGESDTSRFLQPMGDGKMDDLVPHPTRPSVFATSCRGGGIVIFDVRDGTRLLEFAPGFEQIATNAALRLAFSRAGDRLAIGRTGPGGIVVHDAADGRKLVEWKAPRSGRLEFSPDGTMLLQTSADRRRLEMWDSIDGTHRWEHKDSYQAARFLGDGQRLASYCWVEGLRLVQSVDGSNVMRLPGDYFQEFAPQQGGNLLVAVNPMGFVRGFELADGRLRFEIQPHESDIRRVAFLPGGERFITAATLPDGRQALQCWDAGTGRACQNLNGGSGEIRNFSLHPLSGEVIVGGRDLRVWDTASVLPLRVIRGNNAHPSAVFWGSNDDLFAPSTHGFMGAELQSISGTEPTVRWTPPDNDYGQPSVSADGRRVAIGRYNSSAIIKVLERAGQELKPIASLRPKGLIAHVRIAPGGDRVAVLRSDFTGLEILNVVRGKPAVALEVADIRRFTDVVWLNSGDHLAGLVTTHAPRRSPGSVEQIVLWDMATGGIVRRLTNASITSVACPAPDGRRFVEAGADRNVRLRDGTTLEVVREFRVHNAPLTALAWHPTRPILATASEDLGIRLWNLDDGTRLEELRGPLSPPSVLSFSPDGTRLATASRDRVARIWEPRSLAKAIVRK